MLEGFNEMDTLTDRGFLPGMSKVCLISFSVVTVGKTNCLTTALQH